MKVNVNYIHLPLATRLFLPSLALLLLSGCGGGSSSGEPLAVTRPSAQINEITYIFERFTSFSDAKPYAYALNVNSGILRAIDPETELYDFLSKQPDIASAVIMAPAAEDSYVALAHLHHDIGLSPEDISPEDISLDASDNALGGFNRIDPGHFFVWGVAGPAPQLPASYDFDVIWYCSDCLAYEGLADAALSVTSENAIFHLMTDERDITLPLMMDKEQMVAAEATPQMLDRTDNKAIGVSQWQAEGAFFGPTAEQAGLLFSLYSEGGVFSAGGVGQKN